MTGTASRSYADLRSAISEELQDLAARRGTTTYDALAAKFPEIAGPSDPKLMKILDEISAEDHAAGQPLKPALVRNQRRNEPGRRFFETAVRIGALHMCHPEDAFLYDTIRRLHDPCTTSRTDFSKPTHSKSAGKKRRSTSYGRLINMILEKHKEKIPSSIGNLEPSSWRRIILSRHNIPNTKKQLKKIKFISNLYLCGWQDKRKK